MESMLDNYLNEREPPLEIYPYQKDGIEFMLKRCSEGKGTLLGDNMGLGKTIQICTLLELIEAGRVLLVCPNSIIFQWVRELHRVSKSFRVFVNKSHSIQETTMGPDGQFILSEKMGMERLNEDDECKITVCNFHAVAPFPGVPERDGVPGGKIEISADLNRYIPELTPFDDIEWDLVIVDEVHVLRNGIKTSLDEEKATKRPLIYHRLSRLRMSPGGVRIGLTGTPIQNKISDVVSILKFLGADVPRRVNPELVKGLITEYMFRRTEDDLHPVLRSRIRFPEVPYENNVIYIEYESEEEEQVYKVVAGALTGDRVTGEIAERYAGIIYDDRILVRLSLLRYLSADINMFIPIHNKLHETELPYWGGTESKLMMVAAQIAKLALAGESIIVFAHFYEEINGIMAAMERMDDLGMGSNMGYEIFEINGKKTPQEREYVVFETKRQIEAGNRCLLFATIKASAEGLNLQHFSHGIFPTVDWNPSVEEQAIKRMHRIGQTRLVHVYRFAHKALYAGNIEHIDNMMEKKQETKRMKAEEYVDMAENAAHHWPIRDMDDFPGEKCVVFAEREEAPKGVVAKLNHRNQRNERKERAREEQARREERREVVANPQRVNTRNPQRQVLPNPVRSEEIRNARMAWLEKQGMA